MYRDISAGHLVCFQGFIFALFYYYKEGCIHLVSVFDAIYEGEPPSKKLELSSGGQAVCSIGFPC